MHADLSSAEAREERLGLAGAGLPVAVAILMVDAAGNEATVKRIPSASFVGMDRGGRRDAGGDGLHGLPLGSNDGSDGDPAALALSRQPM